MKAAYNKNRCKLYICKQYGTECSVLGKKKKSKLHIYRNKAYWKYNIEYACLNVA